MYIFIQGTKGKSRLWFAKKNKEEKCDDGLIEMGVIKYERNKTQKENNLCQSSQFFNQQKQHFLCFEIDCDKHALTFCFVLFCFA